MTIDPTRNAVGFLLRRGEDGQGAVADAATRDEDCVQQAWEEVRRTHQARPEEVTALYTQWQPSERDAAFIAQTFPDAEVSYDYARPAPDGWDAAFAEARVAMEEEARQIGLASTIEQMEATHQAKLLPVLAGPSSGRGDAMLDMAAHHPLVSGKVYALLAFTGPTPRGTVGLHWVTEHIYEEELGGPPFADLLAIAGQNLAEDLRVDGYQTDDGDVLAFKRDGWMAASALVLPDFYDRMSSALSAERLIVGIPSPDDLLVADADRGAADEVRTMTMETDYDQGFLGPTLLLVDRSGMQLVAERQI